MRVLFASGIDGFCHRYAVLHWAEQLAAHGIASTARAHTDPRLATDLASHDLLVLYRVPDGPWIRHLLARARALGRPTMFAVDDLIIDPALVDPPPTRRMGAAERRLWQDGVERYRRTLVACDAFLATSEPLAHAARDSSLPTYVHRCGLSARELALGETAARARALRDGAGAGDLRAPDVVRLGYFSGTATHDDDVATITPMLCALLERHPQLVLVVGGLVTLDPALASFGARIERLPLVPWPELPARLAAIDVNLAPLDWQDAFVAAKGAVKYLEAAAVAVPTVASPIEAFRHAIRDGETGLLATDAPSWSAALTGLIEDPPRRRRIGAAARTDVATRFAPGEQGRDLRAILERVVAAHRARPRGACEDESIGPDDEVGLARRFPGEVARAAREPSALQDLALAPTVDSPALGYGVVMEQRFRATRSGLMRVDVHTVTYGNPLDHVFEMALKRDDGTPVAALSTSAALAPERDWFSLEFPPEERSADCVYVLELRARGTGYHNVLRFGTTAEPHEYPLGGVSCSGSLALRTFAEDGIGAAAA